MSVFFFKMEYILKITLSETLTKINFLQFLGQIGTLKASTFSRLHPCPQNLAKYDD